MAEVGKMAKINNFDEANDELLTVEEKLYCKKAFSHGRLECCKFALQLDCNEVVSRPPAQARIYDCLLCGRARKLSQTPGKHLK